MHLKIGYFFKAFKFKIYSKKWQNENKKKLFERNRSQ